MGLKHGREVFSSCFKLHNEINLDFFYKMIGEYSGNISNIVSLTWLTKSFYIKETWKTGEFQAKYRKLDKMPPSLLSRECCKIFGQI